ncbi:MAG: DUF2147 domain-containing protein [Bacteroidota bacterium]
MKMLLSFLVVLSISFNSISQTRDSDLILGQYWTENKEGKIEVYKNGNSYFGKIVWRKEIRKDTENPDRSLRDRSVIGIVFMKDFIFKNDKWVDGKVYSIDNGNTYSGKMWLENSGSTLKMRGYLGISLLGRTATLTRVKDE